MKKPLKVEIDGVVFDENITSVRVFVDPEPEPEPVSSIIKQGAVAAVDFSQARVIHALRAHEARAGGPQCYTALWISQNVNLDMEVSSVSALLSRLKTTFSPSLITNDSEKGDGSRGRWWCLTERGRTVVLVGTTPNANKRLESLFHQW